MNIAIKNADINHIEFIRYDLKAIGYDLWWLYKG